MQFLDTLRQAEDSLGKSSLFKGQKKKYILSLEFCMKVPNGSLEKVVQVVGADF